MSLSIAQCNSLIDAAEVASTNGSGRVENPLTGNQILIRAGVFRNLLTSCARHGNSELNARIARIAPDIDLENVDINDRSRSRPSPRAIEPQTEPPPRSTRTRARPETTPRANVRPSTATINKKYHEIRENLYKNEYLSIDALRSVEGWDILERSMQNNLESMWHSKKIEEILKDIPTMTALESNPHYIGMNSYDKKNIKERWITLHPPKTPSRSKSKSSRTLSSKTMDTYFMVASCKNKFKDIIQATKTPGYPVALKNIAYKLAKTCSKVNDTKTCTIDNLDNKIAALRQIWRLSIHRDYGTNLIELKDVIKGSELQIFVREAGKYKGGMKKFFRLSRDNFIITYKDQIGVDGGGLFTQFMQNMSEQLFSRFFVPVDTTGATYTFKTGMKNLESVSVCGSIITFLMLNGIKFNYHLSRSILARLLYKDTEIRKEEYILYHLLDSPEFGNQFKNFMFNPENIEHSMLTLDNENDVTVNNFRTYMEEVTLSLVTSQKQSMDAFSQGVLCDINTRNTLRNLKFTISELDAIMSGEEITKDAIEEIIVRIAHFGQRHPNIFKWFCAILRNQVEFPKEIMEAKRDSKDKDLTALRDHNKFLKTLLYFWTGCSNYNSNFSYTVEVSDSNIHSHTCAYMLVLPNEIICPTQEKLYNHIISYISFDNFDII